MTIHKIPNNIMYSYLFSFAQYITFYVDRNKKRDIKKTMRKINHNSQKIKNFSNNVLSIIFSYSYYASFRIHL